MRRKKEKERQQERMDFEGERKMEDRKGKERKGKQRKGKERN